ncbi:glycoside hydrolase family 15 protein [Herbiconiux sp. CPCC 205716]|uniref:Glycoside hydrolase family 15 protein n=1 Tax=Herbiconiux gentiana TaxID=2970912 RepID=A0ABT2GHD5_9MICO|nr:glycoside hydrolase family 15 protein [Herbiconiux gentiana]MCS5715629.1 glycoside hydrolase family 15 protein [Herbiconiux gentiana]
MTPSPAGSAPQLPTRYVDLRDYAAIGDGRTVALIALDGQVDWMPVPALHSPPVFAALVDGPGGGRFELRPEGDFTTERRYVEGTNVLQTTFTTATGVVRVTDALVTGVAGRLPWLELARRIEGLEGSVPMRWAVVPGAVFDGLQDDGAGLDDAEDGGGTSSHEDVSDRASGPLVEDSGEDGSDIPGVKRVDTVHGPLLRVGRIDLVLVGSEHGRIDPAEPGDGFPDGPLSFYGAFTATAGSRHLLTLCGTDDEPIHVPVPENVDRGIDRSIESWQAWTREFDGPDDEDDEWTDVVQRSALALKLLIFSPTGSIAAAATTGLPENRTGGKNYDYRFAWVRDLAYTVGALVEFGLREETHAAVSWVLKTLKQYEGELHIFFRLDGSLPGEMHDAPAEGWRGIGPVRIGNDASDQLQLGVYADVVGIMARYVDAGNILDERTSELIVAFTDAACRNWPKKDSGMWELPEEEHYVSSKVGCWQAITDALHLAEIGEIKPSDDDLSHWRENRRLIEEWVAEHGWSEERGSYLMHPGSDRLDASILLHADRDFGPRARMDATIARIDEELSAGPLLYRYSGVDEEEGTFVACAFWLTEALARTGRVGDASERMRALIPLANDVGLYSEIIAASDHAFLGNLPQGLSHLALINAALSIRSAGSEARV